MRDRALRFWSNLSRIQSAPLLRKEGFGAARFRRSQITGIETASVDKVIVLGNLGRDPETRYTADGAAITNITVATSRRYKDASGQQQEETEWHRIVFFGRQAEIAAEYLRKGRPVYVEGRLKTRKWQDKDTGADRYSTEIVAETMQLLGDREDAGAAPASVKTNSAPASRPPGRDPVPADDNIPF